MAVYLYHLGVSSKILGPKVNWNSATKTVTATKGTTTIKLSVGLSEATVNGKRVKITGPSKTVNGSTMVPLHFVSESLGGNVRWNGSTYTAYIESAGGGTINNGAVKEPDVTGTLLPAQQVGIVDYYGVP
jgi:hypothetical protein